MGDKANGLLCANLPCMQILQHHRPQGADGSQAGMVEKSVQAHQAKLTSKRAAWKAKGGPSLHRRAITSRQDQAWPDDGLKK